MFLPINLTYYTGKDVGWCNANMKVGFRYPFIMIKRRPFLKVIRNIDMFPRTADFLK